MKKITCQILSAFLAVILASYALVWTIPHTIQDIVTSSPSDDLNNGGQNDELPESSTPPLEQPEQQPDNTPNLPIDPEEPSQPEEEMFAQYIRAKVNGLNLRSGPGSGFSSVGYIDNGDMVTFLGREGNWYLTRYKNKNAYISAESSYTEIFLMEKHEDIVIETVIEYGLSLLGFPYVYGAIRLHDGNGRLLSNFNDTKYDCSSLTQFIYYHGAKINLNMTTRTQVKQGTYVPKNELQRGDLIFFTNSQRYNKTGVERIGHVALYLGENYILHTASDYAVIEPISARRWSYYIEARRFVD